VLLARIVRWSRRVVLILNKRRSQLRADERRVTGRDDGNVVAFVGKPKVLGPLERLVVFLAKRAAEEDHRAATIGE